MSTISERVQRGAEWLDENFLNWIHLVDLNTLRLSSPCRCVLGQLFGDYVDAPLIDLNGNAAGIAHGFNVGADDLDEGLAFDALEAEWRRVITERRAAA